MDALRPKEAVKKHKKKTCEGAPVHGLQRSVQQPIDKQEGIDFGGHLRVVPEVAEIIRIS